MAVGRLPLQRLVEEEQIGENGAHVARCVQVVHKLRSNRGLSEHEPDRGPGAAAGFSNITRARADSSCNSQHLTIRGLIDDVRIGAHGASCACGAP